MTPDPIEGAVPPERRRAVWPWLLMPLAALALFFALTRLRETAPLSEPAPAAAPSEPSQSEPATSD